MNKCPGCEQVLENTNSCVCGWKILDEQKTNDDGICRYKINNSRCREPGTMSPFRYGSKAAEWYCAQHGLNLNDPEYCKKILLENEKNVEKIKHKNKSWRESIFPEEFSIRKK